MRAPGPSVIRIEIGRRTFGAATFVGAVAALGFASTHLLASPVGAPGDQPFVPRTPITADEVNARFDALIAAINDNDARVAPLEEPLTLRYTSGDLDLDTTGDFPPAIVYFDGQSFDNSNGAVTTSAANGWLFTAPHEGQFLVSAVLNWGECGPSGDPTVHGRVRLLVNGTAVSQARAAIGLGTPHGTSGLTDIVELDQDDELRVEAMSNCADGGAEVLAGSYVTLTEVGGPPSSM